jgi:hypothetical protein
MERLFSAGLAVGFFISGVAAILITISQQLGMALIVVAVIVGFLFVNPKSPVRRKWWSVSGELGVVVISKVGVSREYLTVHVGLRAVSVIQVDKIVLRIARKQLLSDWKSARVEADETRYINFTRPNWLHIGDYRACVIAYTPDGFSKSEKFSLIVDQ